jgi:Holliday junction resolvasome RuvABC endonuclease subunit
MRVLGIDGGLTKPNPTGVAIVDVDRGHFVYGAALVAPAGDWYERVRWLAGRIHLECTTWQPDLLAWELPPFMKGNAQTLIKLSHLGGVVIGVASALGIDCQPVQPSEAKQALTTKGNANKLEMIAAAFQRFNVAAVKDVADAAGVALAGEHIYCQRMLARKAS